MGHMPNIIDGRCITRRKKAINDDITGGSVWVIQATVENLFLFNDHNWDRVLGGVWNSTKHVRSYDDVLHRHCSSAATVRTDVDQMATRRRKTFPGRNRQTNEEEQLRLRTRRTTALAMSPQKHSTRITFLRTRANDISSLYTIHRRRTPNCRLHL